MNKNAPIESFDALPDSAHVDVHTVAALFGCKAPTVWLRVRRGQLPQPHKFGMHTRWNVGDIRAALSGFASNTKSTSEIQTKAQKQDSPEVSLRDQFAISAMTGLLSAGWAEDERVISTDWRTVAVDAYKMADAMILARNSK